MSKDKRIQQIVLILSILIVVGTSVVLVRADTSRFPFDASSDITTSKEIEVDNVTQSVSFGDSEADLVEPETVVTDSERDEVRDSGYELLEGEEDSSEATIDEEKEVGYGLSTAIISWDTLQDKIDSALDGDVIDLSGLSTPEDGKAYTFIVGSNKILTFKGNNTRIKNIAFVFNSHNAITIENLDFNSAINHVDTNDSRNKGYSPLHFTGRGNILTLKGYNTVISGQTRSPSSSYGAVIGVPFGAELTISKESDGVIYATGGNGGAVIGGGYESAGGDITIAGGTIMARHIDSSFFSGAGIGGGVYGDGGNITITGGTITTKGGTGGAGIGGGTKGAGGTITITGGTIHSTGGPLGAGIGGGTSGAGGNVTIAGGSVYALGDAGLNNIGAGAEGTGGTLKNSTGDDVYLNTLTLPGKGYTAITAGSINGVTCIDGMPIGGAYGIKDVTTDANGKVYFYLPISGNSGSRKEIISLTAGSNTGYILYARGNMTMEKKLTLLDGIPQNWDEVQFYIDFSSHDTINLSELSTPGDGVVYIFNVKRGRTITLKGDGEQIENIAFVFGGNNTVTIEDMNIKSANDHVDSNDSSKKGYSPLHFTGTDNHLIFKGTNTVISGQTTNNRYYGAGIGVSSKAVLTINTVYGDTASSLNVIGGNNGTGIGNIDTFLGDGEAYIINIYGGTVNVTGGVEAPGISSQIINISGGTVNASGGSSCPGIGPRSLGGYTTVNISGGIVNAIGGGGAAGIGDGYSSAYTKVNISGGIVTALGGRKWSGIGGDGTAVSISGGIVNATGGQNGAGIGGHGAVVSISGGMVTATGGNGDYDNGGAGIGYEGSSGTINISGGTVNATGGIGQKYPSDSTWRYPSGSGIGEMDNIVVISGGSVNAKGGTDAKDIDGTVINSMGAAVFLNTLTLTNAVNASITAGSINGTACVVDKADGIAYGIKDVKTDADGKVYFYLPISDDTESVILTADGVGYSKSYQRLSDDNTHILLAATLVTVTAPEDIFYGQLLGDPIATALMGGNNFIYSYSGTIGTIYGPTETKPSSVGSYVITATLVSETHSGSGTAEFSILPKALTSDMLTITKTYTYNGIAQAADFILTDGSAILELDTDYENVSYSNNIKAGAATLSITGKGNYSGTVSKKFHIEKARLTADGVAINRVYDGTTEVEVLVTPTNKVGDDRIALTAVGTLMDPNVGENKPVMISGFQLVGEDAGNYLAPEAVSGKVTVNIYKAEEPSISNPTVKINYKNASSGNKVNLASLLPVDCGTTKYTVTSSNTLVSSSFVDGNGILTFATGVSDSVAKEDITVKAEMLNYTEATITVTVDFVEVKVPIEKPIESRNEAITIPAQGKKPEVTGTASATEMSRESNSTWVVISQKFVTEAISKAKADAKIQGKTANDIAVDMNVIMSKGEISLNIALPRNSLNSLVNAGVSRFTISGSRVNVSFDQKALNSIQKKIGGNVTISIALIPHSTVGARATIGKKQINDIKVSYFKEGKIITFSTFNSGKVTVSIPYTSGKS